MNLYDELLQEAKTLHQYSVALDHLRIIHENKLYFNVEGGSDHLIDAACEVLSITPSCEGIAQTMVDGMKKFGRMLLAFLQKTWKFFGSIFSSSENKEVQNRMLAALGLAEGDIKKLEELYSVVKESSKVTLVSKKDALEVINKVAEQLALLDKVVGVDSIGELPELTVKKATTSKGTLVSLGYNTLDDLFSISAQIVKLEATLKPIMTRCNTIGTKAANELNGATTTKDPAALKATKERANKTLQIVQKTGTMMDLVKQLFSSLESGIVKGMQSHHKTDLTEKMPTLKSAKKDAEAGTAG